MSPQSRKQLWDLGFGSIKELEVENGILASGRQEVYGCIFGRDSLITSLKLLRAYEKTHSEYFLSLTKKILLNLAELQGTNVNIESGEEPGKIIHEFRPTDHERLTQAAENPWFLYPDNKMRNYDSVDSTPLFLMAVHEYYRLSNDSAFVEERLPQIHAALDWLLVYGDTNDDGFIDYQFNSKRTFGGLKSQSWMDSAESVFFENYDEHPSYPIAPVEAQGYAYAALRSWAAYFDATDHSFSQTLSHRAGMLKDKFNEAFILHGRKDAVTLAFAIDGKSRPLTSARSSMGHILWACPKENISSVGEPDCILESQYIPAIATRLLQPDLYVRSAGIRTLSSRSKKFDPHSYHNGSIWPHDTTIVAQGLENFGFKEAAKQVRASILKAYAHFETPIELFVYADRKFGQYMGPNGQGACQTQAWSAASLLTMLGEEE
jgi:glycogen debranching enzyme